MKTILKFKTTKLIIILSLFVSSFAFSAEKMPGEYMNNDNINNLFKEIEFRGDLKDGYYEVYNVVSRSMEVDEIRFSIFDDKSKILKWMEIGIKTLDRGNISSRILTDKGLLQGKVTRIQIKYVKYHPFEIDLSKNPHVKKALSNKFLKSKKKEILKDQKFVKNSTIKIAGNVYKTKIYRIKNKTKDIEYALLEDKETRVLGLAYLKDKNGISLYLKEIGSNSLSIFPKEVPVLDFIGKIAQMSESFMKENKDKEKALKREEKLEKEDEINKDDPILKLNNMLKKEGE